MARLEQYNARRYGASTYVSPDPQQREEPVTYREFASDEDYRSYGASLKMKEAKLARMNAKADYYDKKAYDYNGNAEGKKVLQERAASYQAMYERELREYQDSLRNVRPEDYKKARGAAPKDYRTDLLNAGKYPIGEEPNRVAPLGTVGYTGVKGGPGDSRSGAYALRGGQYRVSSVREVTPAMQSDREQYRRAAQTPGTYRLSDGSTVVSSLGDGDYGRVRVRTPIASGVGGRPVYAPEPRGRMISGFDLFNPQTREAIKGNAARYKTAGALYGAAAAQQDISSLPYSVDPRAVQRQANIRKAQADLSYFFPNMRDPSMKGFNDYLRQKIAPAVARDESRRWYKNPIPSRESGWLRIPQNFGRGVLDQPNEFLKEPVGYLRGATSATFAGTALGGIGGKATTVLGQWSTRAGKTAEWAAIGAGAGTAGYELYRNPEAFGRNSLAMSLGAVGFGAAYSKMNVNRVDFGALEFTEPLRATSRGSLYGGATRAGVPAYITEFGKTRSQWVDVLVTAQGRRRLPTGRYAMDYGVSTDSFTFRGRSVRAASQYRGIYSPKTQETIISLGRNQFYMSRAASGKYSTDIVAGSEAYSRYPLQYAVFSKQSRWGVSSRSRVVGGTYDRAFGIGKGMNNPIVRRTVSIGKRDSFSLIDYGQANVEQTGFSYNQYRGIYDRTYAAPANRPEYLLSRPSGVRREGLPLNEFESMLRDVRASQGAAVRPASLRRGLDVLRQEGLLSEQPSFALQSLGKRGQVSYGLLEQQRMVRQPRRGGMFDPFSMRSAAPIGLPLQGFGRTSIPVYARAVRDRTVARAQAQSMMPMLRALPRQSSIPRSRMMQSVIPLQRQERLSLNRQRQELFQMPDVMPPTLKVPGLVTVPNRPPVTPPPAWLPGVGGPLGGGMAFGGGTSRKYRYTPSLVALAFGITARKGGKQSGFTGLETRPIIVPGQRKKKRR